MPYTVYVDTFSETEHLVGKARTYEAIKAAVLEAGRFSVFEATDTQRDARMFDRLCTDPELVITDLGFPWTGVRRRLPDEPAASPPEPPVDAVMIGPLPKAKPYHMAAKVDNAGNVSPLCAGDRPRKINLKRETWTLRPEAVTCPKCLKALEARAKEAR